LPEADRPTWSLRELASTFDVNPRKSPDVAWAFASRFMFVLAYAVLTTYQVYYLLDKIGSAEAEVPRQIFLGTLVQSVVVVAASLIGGKLSDRTGRRKIFILTAAVVYGLAMFALAIASNFNGFLVGMAIGQGSRRVQHRRRASLLRRAGYRPGHPGARQWQLRRAVRGRRGLGHHRSPRHPAREGYPVRTRNHHAAHHMW